MVIEGILAGYHAAEARKASSSVDQREHKRQMMNQFRKAQAQQEAKRQRKGRRK